MDEAARHAMEIVREADRDRYLSVLFAPVDRRPALFALYAFNAEVARIRDVIHEPMPGEIRLQWWRDALSREGGEGGSGHPVAAALLTAIRQYDLPVPAFLHYLEARIFDLYDDPMPSRNDLEGYCGETAGAILQLAGLILDRDAALATASLAGHAGCAQAITGLLRLLPIHRARGQCYVPRDILAAAGTSPEDFVAGEPQPAIRRALEAMIALAREHVRALEEGARALPASLRPAYLPAALAPAYLARLERAGVAPLLRIADISALRRYLLVTRRALLGWG